jgi:hypothetical protein
VSSGEVVPIHTPEHLSALIEVAGVLGRVSVVISKVVYAGGTHALAWILRILGPVLLMGTLYTWIRTSRVSTDHTTQNEALA